MGLKEKKDNNRSTYITSQTGLCDENEHLINRSRCYATVSLIDNVVTGCVWTSLDLVIPASSLISVVCSLLWKAVTV
jgi:hypothetical protein